MDGDTFSSSQISSTYFITPLCPTYSTFDLLDLAFDAQLKFLFGFDKSNGVAMALAIIFGALTAIMAAIAGSLKSYGPATATPPRP